MTERLPEDGYYLATLDGELVGQEEPFTGMCGIENGKWDDEDCVMAWMPLPEPYREVFTLRVFAELPYTQIGELFGKSENWARVTYYRAKQKIKEGL